MAYFSSNYLIFYDNELSKTGSENSTNIKIKPKPINDMKINTDKDNKFKLIAELPLAGYSKDDVTVQYLIVDERIYDRYLYLYISTKDGKYNNKYTWSMGTSNLELMKLKNIKSEMKNGLLKTYIEFEQDTKYQKVDVVID